MDNKGKLAAFVRNATAGTSSKWVRLAMSPRYHLLANKKRERQILTMDADIFGFLTTNQWLAIVFLNREEAAFERWEVNGNQRP